MQVYKFDKWWVFLAGIVIFGTVPVMSIYEIASTGSIDMDSVGRGNRAIRTWILYLVSWLGLIYFAIVFYLPAFEAIFRGYAFKIEGESIIIKGRRIGRSDIKDYKFTLIGTKIVTDIGTVYFHRSLNYNGISAFDDFIRGGAI